MPFPMIMATWSMRLSQLYQKQPVFTIPFVLHNVNRTRVCVYSAAAALGLSSWYSARVKQLDEAGRSASCVETQHCVEIPP